MTLTSGMSIYYDDLVDQVVVLSHLEFRADLASLHGQYVKHIAESMAATSSVLRKHQEDQAWLSLKAAQKRERKTR